MAFNLSNLNPPTRFYWGEEGKSPEEIKAIPESEREWVELRLVPDSVQSQIRRECGIVRKSEYRADKAGRPNRIDFLDASEENLIRFNDKLNDYSISAWHLLDGSGGEIECKAENKKILLGGVPRFAKWINEKLELLGDLSVTQKMEGRENL